MRFSFVRAVRAANPVARYEFMLCARGPGARTGVPRFGSRPFQYK
jgi:hypothetical protein